MSEAKREIDSIKESTESDDYEILLTDCILLELYSNPVSIPCGHSFNQNAIEEHYKQNHEKECPACRAKNPTQQFTPNLVLDSLVRLHKGLELKNNIWGEEVTPNTTASSSTTTSSSTIEEKKSNQSKAAIDKTAYFQKLIRDPSLNTIFLNPVLLQCGHTVEEQNLLEKNANSKKEKLKCPCCQKITLKSDLIPNIRLKEVIEFYLKQNPDAQRDRYFSITLFLKHTFSKSKDTEIGKKLLETLKRNPQYFTHIISPKESAAALPYDREDELLLFEIIEAKSSPKESKYSSSRNIFQDLTLGLCLVDKPEGREILIKNKNLLTVEFLNEVVPKGPFKGNSPLFLSLSHSNTLQEIVLTTITQNPKAWIKPATLNSTIEMGLKGWNLILLCRFSKYFALLQNLGEDASFWFTKKSLNAPVINGIYQGFTTLFSLIESSDPELPIAKTLLKNISDWVTQEGMNSRIASGELEGYTFLYKLCIISPSNLKKIIEIDPGIVTAKGLNAVIAHGMHKGITPLYSLAHNPNGLEILDKIIEHNPNIVTIEGLHATVECDKTEDRNALFILARSNQGRIILEKIVERNPSLILKLDIDSYPLLYSTLKGYLNSLFSKYNRRKKSDRNPLNLSPAVIQTSNFKTGIFSPVPQNQERKQESKETEYNRFIEFNADMHIIELLINSLKDSGSELREIAIKQLAKYKSNQNPIKESDLKLLKGIRARLEKEKYDYEIALSQSSSSGPKS